MGSAPPPQTTPLLRRRNSIASSDVSPPPKIQLLHRNSFPRYDRNSPSTQPATYTYSSLKDLLPTESAGFPSPDICIKNRLVKKAASAYLRPMSVPAGSFKGGGGGNIFRRLWRRVVAVVDIFCRNVVRAFDGTFRNIAMRNFRTTF